MYWNEIGIICIVIANLDIIYMLIPKTDKFVKVLQCIWYDSDWRRFLLVQKWSMWQSYKIGWVSKIFETNENVINKTLNNLKNWQYFI